MKKITKIAVFFLAIIMLLSAMGIQIAAADDSSKADVTFVLAGDMNKNDKIEISDARTILRIAVKIEANVTEEMLRIADFDYDASVKINDARAVLRIAVKLDVHPEINNEKPNDAKADLLTTYIEIMQKAKEDKPAFTTYTYKTMPDNSTDRVIKRGGLGNLMSDVVFSAFENLNFLISESSAKSKADSYEAGTDMKAFPMYDSEKGCLLTDASLLKSVDYVPYTNGTAQITLVLKNEVDPKDPSKNGTINSITGLMFDHMTSKEVTELLAPRAFDTRVKDYEFTRTYHDCTVVVTYKQGTKEIVSLEQTVVCSVDFKGNSLGFSPVEIIQNIYSTTKFVDFDYVTPGE